MSVVSFHLCDTATAYNVIGGFKPKANTRFAFVGWGQLVLSNTLDQVLSIVSLIRDRMGTPAQGNTLAGVDGAIGTQTTAIKAKTDNLPALPASQGDVTTVGAEVSILRGLAGRYMTWVPSYDGSGNQTGMVIYLWATKAAALDPTHNTPIDTFTGQMTFDVNHRPTGGVKVEGTIP